MACYRNARRRMGGFVKHRCRIDGLVQVAEVLSEKLGDQAHVLIRVLVIVPCTRAAGRE
jgi:hypothetical protein